ncbi:MAG: ArsB/NhaD family transporter [Dehalococcoidales bacterium]|nr:ArsB/NhaD family transporter [Dehalococcoidales bacterium]
MLLTLGIFVLSLVLIMVRPRPLNEGTAASLGAFLMLVTGLVSPPQAIEVFKANANILLFFVGLMVISAVADQAGFFAWSAVKAIRLAGGDGRKLLLVIFGLGILITTFFSNDSTALIMTPIVFALVTHLRMNPLPYVFVCTFIANTASIILPVSTPVNILPVDSFGLTLGEYLRHLWLPAILVIAVNILLFLFIFRKDIPARFQDDSRENVKIGGFFLFTCVGLVLIAAGYLVASAHGWPLAWPAVGGAALLVAGAAGFRHLNLRRVRSGISWSILLFIVSLGWYRGWKMRALPTCWEKR